MAYTKYSLTPANNTAAPPDGAPEGMLPSAVNDTMRDMMAQIRDCGDGIRDGTYTMTAPKITGGTITGSTINNSAIGGTTAAAGAFTTLSATGVTTVQAGTVSLPAITTTGDTNTGIFFPAADTIAFTEGGTESMRIDASGNVGIGTSSPAQKLDIASKVQIDTANSYGKIKIARATDSGVSALFIQGADNAGTANELSLVNSGGGGAAINITGGDLRFYATSNTTERMRITSDGKVGVGTSAPPNTLTAWTGGTLPAEVANAQLLVGNTTGFANAGIALVANASNDSTITFGSTASPTLGRIAYSNTNNAFLFYTNGTNERMRIDSSGNVLVGKTSKNNTSGNGFQCEANGTVNVVTSSSTSSFDTYEIYSTGAGAYRFYVTAAGVINATSTSITAISDQRLKENVRPLELGLTEVMALQPRRYDWIEGKGQNKKDAVGFIAQEFETVLPNSVGTSKAGQDGIEYKNINYEELVPMLVKAVQELNAKVDAQAVRIAELESK